ncbi:MAG: CBS domain-containing protein, partial [candidate division Zixibacteria bacterium]|nr:CBS domain-containing protein [candidate division Zixibacteria bacterium]
MSSKRAGEIMIPIEDYPKISFWSTLHQAVDKLEESTLEAHG